MCVYIDGGGNWSTKGCELVSYSGSTGEVECKCSHLTNFAILVVSLLFIHVAIVWTLSACLYSLPVRRM